MLTKSAREVGPHEDLFVHCYAKVYSRKVNHSIPKDERSQGRERELIFTIMNSELRHVVREWLVIRSLGLKIVNIDTATLTSFVFIIREILLPA